MSSLWNVGYYDCYHNRSSDDHRRDDVGCGCVMRFSAISDRSRIKLQIGERCSHVQWQTHSQRKVKRKKKDFYVKKLPSRNFLPSFNKSSVKLQKHKFLITLYLERSNLSRPVTSSRRYRSLKMKKLKFKLKFLDTRVKWNPKRGQKMIRYLCKLNIKIHYTAKRRKHKIE